MKFMSGFLLESSLTTMTQPPKLSSGLSKDFLPAFFHSVMTAFQRSLPTWSIHLYFGLFTPLHPSGLEIKNLWHFSSLIFIIRPVHVYLQSCITVETSGSYKSLLSFLLNLLFHSCPGIIIFHILLWTFLSKANINIEALMYTLN
jgi:hypothetical protein